MAKNPVRRPRAAAQPAAPPQEPLPETQIERDSNFRRYYADDLVAVRRRFDTQLSFIIKGDEPSAFAKPEPSRAAGSTGTLPVGLVSAANEVARVHVPNGLLFNFAMQLLDEFITAQPQRADYALDALSGLIKLRREEAGFSESSEAQ